MPVQPMPQRIPVEKWEAYFALLTAGMARHKAAKQAGIAITTVERLHQDPRRSTGYAVYREWVANNVRDVVTPNRLGTAPRKAIKDFEYFRERYFGHISMPWQVEAANRMHALRESPAKEFVVVNAPPGCLAGDTEIVVNRGGAARRMRLDDLVRKFNGETLGRRGEKTWDRTIPTRVQRAVTGNQAGCYLRLVDLVAAVRSGVKTTYTLTTDSGRTIRATADHPFMVNGGAMIPLRELRPGDEVLVNGGKSRGRVRRTALDYRTVEGLLNHPSRGAWPYRQPLHRLVVEADMNGLPLSWYVALLRDSDCETSGLKFLGPEVHVHHRDEDIRNNELDNLEVLDRREHGRHHGQVFWANVADQVVPDRIASIVEYGEEETYDLTVLTDPHNFVASGFVVHNSGKSTLFTHDYPIWEIVQNRALRCLIGTGAENTGADYTMRIRMSLERTLPVEADEIEAAQGLAKNARACLVHDFGRFKPEGAAYWRADKLVVAREGGEPAHQKEASFSSYGQKSGFLGGRYNLIVWDDLVNDRNSRAAVQLDELSRWWRKVAETRLEPGGLLILQGQRLGPHDLYRYALDLRDVADALDAEVIDLEQLPRKYHHIRFKAHYEDRCAGVGPGVHHDVATAEPYPKGCLLDPIRLPYRELRVIQHNDPKDYATVYQQEDTDPTSVLVNPIWITGGSDPVSGEIYPGCWDLDRMVGQYPQNLAGDCWSVVTADPSPSNFWGVISWVWQSETQFQHLVDIERSRMAAPELLDWNMSAATWTGLLEEWWQKSTDAGRPITHVIVETNAAQRFLLQYEHAKRWSQVRGVALVSHNTGRNKADAEMGVHALAPQFRHGRVRLPGHNLTRPYVLPLYNEVTRYPDSATTDLTMACWFLLWNAPQLFTRKIAKPPTFNRPSWIRERQRGFGAA
jgi:hypothetical protein